MNKSEKTAVQVPALLWKYPTNISVRNLRYGQGGERHSPHTTVFSFVKEDLSGTNPKFIVTDQSGVKWKIKLGAEAKPEVAASRLVWAVGYFTPEDYYLPELQVTGMPTQLLSDTEMLRILAEKSKAGVEIKILGRAAKIPARKLSHIRLHARVIVRDGSYVSIGSQSLRTLELDSRREVGVVFRDLKSARRITKVFMSDWELAAEPRTGDQVDETIQTGKIAKKVAKAVTKELPPVAEVLDLVVKEVAGDQIEMPLNPDQLQDTVTQAVKRAVKEAVREAVTDATKHGGRAASLERIRNNTC